MDVGEVAMAEDTGIGMGFLQTTEQTQQSAFLTGRAGVVSVAVLVQSAFVADAERVLIVACGMSTHQLLVACLVGPTVSGDVVVIARESESFRVTADKCCHGKVLVRTRGRTMDHNQLNVAHDCTFRATSEGVAIMQGLEMHDVVVSVVAAAVSTVMINWTMVFQRFMSLIIFIVFQLLKGEY